MTIFSVALARLRAQTLLSPLLALPAPSLPPGSTLYVVDVPPALLFAGGSFFLTPAVQWYYPGVETKVVARDEVAEIASSMGDDDRILFFERD